MFTRHRFAQLFSILSFIGGLLIVLPRLSDRVWILQMFLKESGWLAVGTGLFSLLLRPWSIITYLALWLASSPYRQLRSARVAIATAIASFHTHEPRIKRPIARIEYDVIYCRTSSRPLKLDIYLPRANEQESLAAVITIHGGSWEMGDKGDFFGHQRQLAQQGFVVFDIQYRFSHEALWPAQLEDVRAAIRWVKAHAKQYMVDPKRIALLGRSAGGHLALQAAYRAIGEAADTSISAVVAYYPPIELRLWNPGPDSVIAKLLGGTHADCAQAYVDASVTSHLHANVPPTLLVHGAQDALVPIDHSHLLHHRLTELGVSNALLMIPWAEHGFDFVPKGLGRQLVEPAVYDFLWAVLQDIPR